MRSVGKALLSLLCWVALLGLVLPAAFCVVAALAFLIYAWWALSVQDVFYVLHTLGLPQWSVPFFHSIWNH